MTEPAELPGPSHARGISGVAYVKIRDGGAGGCLYVVFDVTAGGEREISGLWASQPGGPLTVLLLRTIARPARLLLSALDPAGVRRRRWGRRGTAAISACDSTLGGSVPLAVFPS